MSKVGLSSVDLAERLNVDPKTASAERDRVAESEIIRVYPRRTALPADLWTSIFDRATAYVDVLVYAGLFLPEQHPEVVASLCDKVRAGVRLRLLLGDPDSQAVATRGAEEGIGEAVAAKIRNAMTLFQPHVEDGCLEVRLHSTTLYASIYRLDHEMLVNTHILGRPAAQAPVIHLRRLSAGDLFDTYAETFERVWATATVWTENQAA